MPTSWAASSSARSASSSACRVRASMSSHEIDKGLVLPVLKEIGDLGGGQFGEFRDRGDEGHGGVCHRCQNVVRRHTDRKSTRLNSSQYCASRMPSSA